MVHFCLVRWLGCCCSCRLCAYLEAHSRARQSYRSAVLRMLSPIVSRGHSGNCLLPYQVEKVLSLWAICWAWWSRCCCPCRTDCPCFWLFSVFDVCACVLNEVGLGCPRLASGASNPTNPNPFYFIRVMTWKRLPPNATQQVGTKICSPPDSSSSSLAR